MVDLAHMGASQYPWKSAEKYLKKARQAATRLSVNYAKEWLDQLFLFPGLEKGFTYGCGR